MVNKLQTSHVAGHREVVTAVVKRIIARMPESTHIEVVHLQVTNGQGVWHENMAARDLELALRMLKAGVTMANATLETIFDCPCGALVKGAIHAGDCPEGVLRGRIK